MGPQAPGRPDLKTIKAICIDPGCDKKLKFFTIYEFEAELDHQGDRRFLKIDGVPYDKLPTSKQPILYLWGPIHHEEGDPTLEENFVIIPSDLHQADE